jgi:hypothetical protein
MKIKSGGGYSSNKTAHSQHYKTEPKAKAIDPAAVAAQGLAVQFKKPELEQGRGYEPARQCRRRAAEASSTRRRLVPAQGARSTSMGHKRLIRLRLGCQRVETSFRNTAEMFLAKEGGSNGSTFSLDASYRP